MSSETSTKKTSNQTAAGKKVPSRMYIAALMLFLYSIFLLLCFSDSIDGTETTSNEKFGARSYVSPRLGSLEASIGLEASDFFTTAMASGAQPDGIYHNDEAESFAGGGVPINNLGNEILNVLDDSLEKLWKKEESIERMLIHTGNINFNVWNGTLGLSVQKIQKLIQEVGDGAYIESKSFYTVSPYDHYYPSEMNTGKQSLKGVNINLRIPNNQFLSFMEIVQTQLVESPDMLLNFHTNSRDVTDDYIDATSRADIIEASRTAMKTLFSKATTISDILNVQNEMNRLTEQIESQRNRAKNLRKKSALSSLSLTIEEKFRPYKKINKINPSDYNVFSGSFDPINVAQKAFANLSSGTANLGNLAVFLSILLFIPFIMIAVIYYDYSHSRKVRYAPLKRTLSNKDEEVSLNL